MPAVRLTNPYDFTTVTNLFLYGQETTPSNYSDRLRASDAPVVTVEIDAASFMSASGPGRYALPYFALYVQTFFQDIAATPPAVQAFVTQRLADQGGSGPVSVTVAELKTLMATTQFDIDFQQRGWDAGSSDYGARTYIYNAEGFRLSDSTRFVFDLSGPNSHIENLAIVPKDDGFDFASGSPLAQLGNDTVLRPNIDPYNLSLGRQLAINFVNIGDIPTMSGDYNLASFNADKGMFETR